MHLNSALYCLFACLAAAGGINAILAYISLWLPVPYLARIILFVYIGFAASGLSISIFLFPGKERLIAAADALGLKERVVTAWQLRQDGSALASLQRQDTVKAARNTDFKRLYPLRFPVKPGLALAAAILLTLASFTIPGFAREEAEYIERLRDEVGEQVEKLDAVKKELENSGTLTARELEKIREELERLADELKKAKTEEEALKALSRAENELGGLDPDKGLKELGEALARSGMTRELGEAVQNKDATALKQALERLAQQMEQKEAPAGELSELLKQAAEQMGRSETAEALLEAAGQLDSGEPGAQAGALQGLESMLSGMMQGNGSSSLTQALGELGQAVRQAKSGISGVDSRLSAAGQSGGSGGQAGNPSGLAALGGSPEGGSAGNSAGPQGGSPGEGAGGQGQGSDSGGGSGTGASSGGGSGSGAGSGAGEGSTNEQAGGAGAEGSGAGRSPGEGREEAYEQLYDPDRLGGGADATQVGGQKQEGGQSRYSQADGMPVQKGAILPYGEVLAQYGSEAAASMEDAKIPAAMKDIVRRYFESLE